MKKLSPSIIAHFPHVWSTQYWDTPNGVPQKAYIMQTVWSIMEP